MESGPATGCEPSWSPAPLFGDEKVPDAKTLARLGQRQAFFEGLCEKAS
jgi:hypothetical protein